MLPLSIYRPDVTGPVAIYGKVTSNQRWFDTSKFSAPAALTLGNVGRNILTGPDLVDLDLSVFRGFAFKERVTLELRGESFNLTNTPHFNSPGGTFGSSTFGVVTSMVSPVDSRGVQLGVKISFKGALRGGDALGWLFSPLTFSAYESGLELPA